MKRFMLPLVLLFLPVLAFAGSVELEWPAVITCIDSNGVSSPCDPDGYKVYFGTSPRDTAVPPAGYTDSRNVGPVLNATIDQLADCTDYYFGVTAVRGLEESTVYSPELVGWPAPAVISTAPDTLERGYTYTLDVAGNNFKAGVQVLTSSGDVSILQVRVVSCTLLAVDVTLAPGSNLGSFSLEARNDDGSYAEQLGAFTIIKKSPGPVQDLRRSNVR